MAGSQWVVLAVFGAIALGGIPILIWSPHWVKRRYCVSKIAGLVMVIVGGLVFTLHAAWYYEKAANAPMLRDIREGKAETVQAVVLLPGAHSYYPRLVSVPVRITGRKEIEEVVNLLHGAESFSPNHPSASWECELALDFGDRVRYCDVSWVNDSANGLLICVWSGRGSGWVIGEFREDRLKPVLERLAKSEEAGARKR